MYKYVLLNGELSKRTNTTTQIGIELTKSELELMQSIGRGGTCISARINNKRYQQP